MCMRSIKHIKTEYTKRCSPSLHPIFVWAIIYFVHTQYRIHKNAVPADKKLTNFLHFVSIWLRIKRNMIYLGEAAARQVQQMSWLRCNRQAKTNIIRLWHLAHLAMHCRVTHPAEMALLENANQIQNRTQIRQSILAARKSTCRKKMTVDHGMPFIINSCTNPHQFVF